MKILPILPRHMLPLLLVLLLFSACRNRGEEREFPDQGISGLDADDSGPEELRITYCKVMKMLYGPGIECMDGGRAFLDQGKEVVAGVVYDGDYALDQPANRYLICMREPTSEDGEWSTLDAITVQWKDGEWLKFSEKRDFMKIPYLESMRTAASIGQPVVKIGYEDEGRRTQYRYLSFGPDSIALSDTLVVPVPLLVAPVCLGEPLPGDPGLRSYANSEKGGGKDFLMTPFERFVAGLLPLVKEEKMPVVVAEDSITRVYAQGNTTVTCVQLIEPNGESSWIRIEGGLCEGGLESLFNIARWIYPELEPFDLNLKGVFGVVVDHEDFQVERKNGAVERILYDSFFNGQQSHIEIKEKGDEQLLEFRFYHL